MNWLGNFYLILIINIVFAVATGLSLVTKFTAAVRREIYVRLIAFISRDKRSQTVGINGSTGLSGTLKDEKEE